MPPTERRQLSAPPPPSPLFRAEAVEALRTAPPAKVLLRPLVGSGWLAAGAMLAALAVVAFLVLGSYTRRATVTGHLAPAAGVLRLSSPAAGWVQEMKARQGQRVAAGEVLFVLSTDRPMVGGADYQGRMLEGMQRRAELLADSEARLRDSGQAERDALQRRIDILQRERPLLERQLAGQRQRVAQAEETNGKWRGLFEQKFATREQWLQKEADLADQRARVQTLERDLLVLARELNDTRQNLAASLSREQQQRELLQREREQLREQTVESEARRRIVVTAPRAGVLTLVHVNQGMSVEAQRPLAQLLPSDEPLVVRLYAPSRAVGFVRPGTPVWLRYEAYPFERYGMQQATVVEVASTPASREELSPWIMANPQAAAEPLYEITARMLDKRFGAAAGNGGALDLRPGMRVDADLLFERRRLLEWMLGPALKVQQQAAP
jgi:membrane fusion protein